MPPEQLWFESAFYAYAPSIVFGFYSLAYGSLAWILGSHGLLKLVMLPVHWIGFFAAWGLVAFGLVALVTGQTSPVWMGFCVPGGIGLAAYPLTFLPFKNLYDRAPKAPRPREGQHHERRAGNH